MKYVIIVFCLLFLISCWDCDSLSNEEIVKQSKYCKDNWMYIGYTWCGFDLNNITKIICLPKND